MYQKCLDKFVTSLVFLPSLVIVTTWNMQAVSKLIVDGLLINLLQVVRFLPAYIANAVSQAYQLANCRIAKHHGSSRFLNHC